MLLIASYTASAPYLLSAITDVLEESSITPTSERAQLLSIKYASLPSQFFLFSVVSWMLNFDVDVEIVYGDVAVIQKTKLQTINSLP